jgi:hypothetical protein
MINNKINTNHLLVTKSKNSILIKIISNITKYRNNMNKNISHSSNTMDIFNHQNNSKSEHEENFTILTRYRFIIGVFELIINF